MGAGVLDGVDPGTRLALQGRGVLRQVVDAQRLGLHVQRRGGVGGHGGHGHRPVELHALR